MANSIYQKYSCFHKLNTLLRKKLFYCIIKTINLQQMQRAVQKHNLVCKVNAMVQMFAQTYFSAVLLLVRSDLTSV